VCWLLSQICSLHSQLQRSLIDRRNMSRTKSFLFSLSLLFSAFLSPSNPASQPAYSPAHVWPNQADLVPSQLQQSATTRQRRSQLTRRRHSLSVAASSECSQFSSFSPSLARCSECQQKATLDEQARSLADRGRLITERKGRERNTERSTTRTATVIRTIKRIRSKRQQQQHEPAVHPASSAHPSSALEALSHRSWRGAARWRLLFWGVSSCTSKKIHGPRRNPLRPESRR